MGMKIFINLSNHPSGEWNEPQLLAAKKLGEIVDIPFPQIPPEASTMDVGKIAELYLELITVYKDIAAVHLMGEMTFTFSLVKLLQRNGIKVLASTTKRNSVNNHDGSRTVVFEFVQFREYP